MAMIGAKRGAPGVRYFDPPEPTRMGRTVLALAQRIGLLGPALAVDRNIGEAADAGGRSTYVRTLREARTVCAQVKREWLSASGLIDAFEPGWSRAKVVHHLERLVEAEVRRECLRIRLVATLSGADPGCLLLAARPWRSQLERYAEAAGVEIRWYASPLDLPGAARQVRRLVAMTVRLAHGLARRPAAAPGHVPGRVAGAKADGQRLALGYGQRTLRPDPMARSEFFWLDQCAREVSGIVLYGYNGAPIDPATARELAQRGIAVFGTAPGAIPWRSTRSMVPVAVRSLARLALAVGAEAIRLRFPAPWVVRRLAALCVQEAYWYDFFRSNRVRLNVVPMELGSVAQVLAMDRLGGVGAAYQYSASDVVAPAVYVSSGEPVQFLFSEEYVRLFRAAEVPAERIVATGFVYGGAVDHVRTSPRPNEIRGSLRRRGASFVVCFFDENSATRWDITASNEAAADDYRHVIRWLLDDPTLGVIAKVKKARDLRARIGAASELIDRAEATGRFILLADGSHHYAAMYPAEAALAADVCVGKLQGTTAGLEARLAGQPTVLVGAPHLWDHPLHDWLGPAVVFDTWDDLRAALTAYRADASAQRAFGEWSDGIHRLDRYRDGRAAARIDGYLAAVCRALREGVPAAAALARADVAAEGWVR